MSGAEIVSLGETRRRKNPFAGLGRHRRTPEAWAQMVLDNQILEARARRAEEALERSNNRIEELDTVISLMREDMTSLRAEVKQVRALMAAAPDQEKVTILPPPSDPEETQPISQAELFADKDPMAAMRPKIRVGTINGPATPSAPSAATQLISRITAPPPDSEMVKHVAVTQPIPLFDSPMARGARVQRNTA
jgi:hypothetical protein